MDYENDNMVVHPSSLGWKEVAPRRWRKPDGNIVEYTPGSVVHVILDGTEAEEKRELIRYGIG